MTKKVAYLGMFTALAFVFSYIESLIPIQMVIPGAKLGLANLVIIVALYLLGRKEAFFLSLVRIVLVGFTFGNMAGMLYSLTGGMLSFLVMVIAIRFRFFSPVGVSVLGGVFHNVGQIIAAILIVKTESLVLYLPALIFVGVVSGALIGILGGIMIKRLKGVMGQ